MLRSSVLNLVRLLDIDVAPMRDLNLLYEVQDLRAVVGLGVSASSLGFRGDYVSPVTRTARGNAEETDLAADPFTTNLLIETLLACLNGLLFSK